MTCCISECRILRSRFTEVTSFGVYLASTGIYFFQENVKIFSVISGSLKRIDGRICCSDWLRLCKILRGNSSEDLQ